MRRVLRHLRWAALLHEGAGCSDGQLLERFVARREESAFAVLVRRHGPMVHGVCRRVLRHEQDAEDAFQATFLVLARKAASVRPREHVGNWLYGVAYRTALRARAMNAKRRAKEQAAGNQKPSAPGHVPEEWLALLDEELNRLPAKYRAPIVLCDLEGKTRTAAARQLGWPVGTLSWRLAAGRKTLARRLTRRGVTLSVAALAAVTPGTTSAALATAAVQNSLLTAGAVPAAVAALSEGVIKMMLLAKLKSVSAVLCGVAALGVATGGIYYQARAGEAGAPRPAQTKTVRQGANRAAADEDRLRTEKVERDLRRALEEARQREQELHRQLDAMRERLLVAEGEIVEVKRREIAANKKLNDEIQKAEIKLAELAGSAQRVNRPEQPADRRPHVDQQKIAAERQRSLEQLDKEREQLRRVFDDRRQNLMDEKYKLDREAKRFADQLDRLREEEKYKLDDIQTRRTGLLRQPPTSNTTSAAGDKLDRILDRLERIERRLDRFERGKP